MSPRARALIGAVTTVGLAVLAMLAFSDGQPVLGAIIGVLAALRGAILIRQIRADRD